MVKSKNWSLRRAYPWLLIVFGAIGLIASLVLTLEYIDLLKNPHYQPVCNLNPIFSCSNVTTSRQAHAFGFPNELIGLAGFAAVATVGVALAAGARLAGWFWRLFNLGSLLAVGFVTWLQYETIYRIGALCLFCMVTWAVTIPLFVYSTFYNLDHGHLTEPSGGQKTIKFVRRHHGELIIIWFLVIALLIVKRFWYYFGNL
jgi:uncharacterized membrane protein